MQEKEKKKDTISKKPRGRYKRLLNGIHPNTPKKLIREYKKLGCNQLHLAKKLGVNDFYLNRLIKDGLEPTDQTEKGRAVRGKLFLPNRSLKCKTCGRKTVQHKQGFIKKDEPDYIKIWKHLPTDERRKVIQEYIKWKKMNS